VPPSKSTLIFHILFSDFTVDYFRDWIDESILASDMALQPP